MILCITTVTKHNFRETGKENKKVCFEDVDYVLLVSESDTDIKGCIEYLLVSKWVTDTCQEGYYRCINLYCDLKQKK